MAGVEFNIDSKKAAAKPVAQPTAQPIAKPVAKTAEPLQEVRIRKVGVVSVANIVALISFITMLLMALIAIGIGSLIPSMSIPTGTGGAIEVDAFSVMSPLQMIIGVFVYAGFAWISGAISALLYNLSAKIAKGVRLFA